MSTCIGFLLMALYFSTDFVKIGVNELGFLFSVSHMLV